VHPECRRHLSLRDGEDAPWIAFSDIVMPGELDGRELVDGSGALSPSIGLLSTA
jgi:hypothetical protein